MGFNVTNFLCFFSIACFDPEFINDQSDFVAGCQYSNKGLKVLTCIENKNYVSSDLQLDGLTMDLHTLAFHNSGPACENSTQEKSSLRGAFVENLIMDQVNTCDHYYFETIVPTYLTVTNSNFKHLKQIFEKVRLIANFLKGLYMNNVNVKDFEKLLFYFSESLETLHCIDCGLQSFEGSQLAVASNLKVLSLRNNKIKKFSYMKNPAIEPLMHLWSVDLSNNRLESIEDIFTFFPKVERIDLTGNRLKIVESSSLPRRVNILHMDQNVTLI